MNQPIMDQHISPPPYLACPDAIYRESFKQIDALIDCSHFPKNLHAVIRRLVHAVGRPEIADIFHHSHHWQDDNFIQTLQTIDTIFTDSEMTRAGIISKNLSPHINITCTLKHPETPAIAQQLQTTQSAAATNLWQAEAKKSIAVIGNAPTALFQLLENIQRGKIAPLLVVAFPVGFVGAAESKDFLMQHHASWDFAWLSLKGREGGSALAAAAINALFMP